MIKSARQTETGFAPNEFTVRQPRMAVWIGVICSLVFLSFTVIMTLFPNDTAEWWVYAVFIAFSLLGAFLAYYCIVWNVRVHEDTIIFNTAFRKPRAFTFNDITEVRQKTDGMAIYCDGRKTLTLQTNCAGYRTLVSRLTDEGILF